MRKNLLLAGLSFLLAITIVEFSLRFFLDKPKKMVGPKTNWAIVPEQIWTEYHPILGWFHQKSKKAILIKDNWQIEIHTNSAGMRGSREYSMDKPAPVTRVLSLGDSFVFGFGVKDDETFSARLEQSDPNLEVLNLGVPAYGLDQMLLCFKEIGRQYNPDLVIVGIFPEDFWRATRSFTDAGYAKPYFILSGQNLLLQNVPTPQPFELKYNQFPDVIESNKIEDFFQKSILYRSFYKAMIRIGKNLGWVDPDSTDEWILGRQLLKALIADIKTAGAQVVLVMIPPDRWVQSPRQDSLRRSLLRFAEREQVPMIDLTPFFFRSVQQSDLTEYYIKDDWHWTAKGHQLAASVLKDFIVKDRLRA